MSYIFNDAGGGGGGSGTVNAGTANQIAYYPASAAAVSGDANLTDNGTTLAYIPGVITLGAAAGTSGSIALKGSTSGTITIQPQAAAGTFNFNLPTTAGSSGQALLSGGGAAAAMTWGSPAITVFGGSTGGTSTLSFGTDVVIPAMGNLLSTTLIANEQFVTTPVSAAGTISVMSVSISSAFGGGNGVTFTLRCGPGSATCTPGASSVTCTISGASATSCQDAAHSLVVGAGDFIDVDTNISSGSPAAKFVHISFKMIGVL